MQYLGENRKKSKNAVRQQSVKFSHTFLTGFTVKIPQWKMEEKFSHAVGEFLLKSHGGRILPRFWEKKKHCPIAILVKIKS